jgi:RND family efflux transporter MFP subunit
MSVHRVVGALALAVTLAAGCGKDDASAAPGPGAAGRGGPGGAGGGAGPSVTLAAGDIAVARRETIEAGTPVTGNLNPLERVDVRARLEGDLVGVYVREGQAVREGELLARIEASQQESGARSAEAAREAARAELATAQWNLDQSDELFRAGAIPERDLKAAQQQVAAARARMAAAEAQVRASSNELRDTYVRSPIGGVVESRAVEGGEHVARGAALLTVVRTDVLELAAAVPARLAGDVRAGQRVRFAAGGRSFEGSVARVSPTVDPASRSVTVYVRIPNPGGALRGGTFASGQVIGQAKPGALVLPSAAVRAGQDGEEPFVWKIADQRLAKTPVRLGIVDESRAMTEILDGVAEGDRVVAGNVGTLGNGMRVEVVGTDQGQGPADRGPGAAAAMPRPRS